LQFATTLAGSAYVAAALYTNADTNAWSEKLGQGSWWRRGSDLPTDEEIKRAKAISTAKVSNEALSRFNYIPLMRSSYSFRLSGLTK